MAELIICPENHPERCQTITPKGQCTNYSQPGDTRCSMHNRSNAAHARKKRIKDLYVNAFSNDINDFHDAGSTDLKAEISIMRTLMQKMLAQCATNSDLIANMGPITMFATKIADIASVIDRIAMNSGNLLDADAIASLATDIVNVLAHHISDTTLLEAIAVDIETLFVNRVEGHRLESKA